MIMFVMSAEFSFGQWQGPANEMNPIPVCKTTSCYRFLQDNDGNPGTASCGQGNPPIEGGCAITGCAANMLNCFTGPAEFTDYNEARWSDKVNILECSSDSKRMPIAQETWFCERMMPCTCAFFRGEGVCASVPAYASTVTQITKYSMIGTLSCAKQNEE